MTFPRAEIEAALVTFGACHQRAARGDPGKESSREPPRRTIPSPLPKRRR